MQFTGLLEEVAIETEELPEVGKAMKRALWRMVEGEIVSESILLEGGAEANTLRRGAAEVEITGAKMSTYRTKNGIFVEETALSKIPKEWKMIPSKKNGGRGLLIQKMQVTQYGLCQRTLFSQTFILCGYAMGINTLQSQANG